MPGWDLSKNSRTADQFNLGSTLLSSDPQNLKVSVKTDLLPVFEHYQEPDFNKHFKNAGKLLKL